MDDNSKPDPALIQKMVDAANYIHKNTKKGQASHILVGNVNVVAYAEKKGMTIVEAIERLGKYFKGETDEF